MSEIKHQPGPWSRVADQESRSLQRETERATCRTRRATREGVMSDQDRERAAFEAWAKTVPLCTDRYGEGPTYVYPLTNLALRTWLACSAASTAENARLREAVECAIEGFVSIRDMNSHGASDRTFIDWLRNNASSYAQMMRSRLSDAPPEKDAAVEESRCVACDLPLKEGDLYYPDDVNGGELHAACCGPEREGYTLNGESLPDGEPIPEPHVWRDIRPAEKDAADWQPIETAPRDEAEDWYLAIKEIASLAHDISAQAGVGTLETAGQIVSFLAIHPELVPNLMDGTLDPIETPLLDHHAGSMCWNGQDGKIYYPDRYKVVSIPPAPREG